MTYVTEFPAAFRCNVACAVSDGITARYGTAFTPFEHFAPWNVDDDGGAGEAAAKAGHDEDLPLNLLLHGLFQPAGSSTCSPATWRSPGRRSLAWLSGSPSRTSTSRSPKRSVRRSRHAQPRPGRRGLAHPGLGQVDGDGAVCEPGAHQPVARQPDRSGPHRQDRPGRPALRHVRAERPAAGAAAPGRHP